MTHKQFIIFTFVTTWIVIAVNWSSLNQDVKVVLVVGTALLVAIVNMLVKDAECQDQP